MAGTKTSKKTTKPKKKSQKKSRKANKKGNARKSPDKRWVKGVSETSDAMDLEKGVFKKSPKGIAKSLKRSVTKSKRRKGTPYQSAMSMLTYEINRGGKGLSASMKSNLEKAKPELRKLFGRDKDGSPRKPAAKGSGKASGKRAGARPAHRS